MDRLKNKIISDGTIAPGNILNVSSFLNHQIDVPLMCEAGKEFYRLFRDSGITKILTIEASGIGISCLTAQYFMCPVVFAKKFKGGNISGDVYTSRVDSFTHGRTYDIIVKKDLISPSDRILIIDDFLALGNALNALISITETAGAKVTGAGIVIEKAFQGGGDEFRRKGYRIESLARIESMSPEDGIRFCD